MTKQEIFDKVVRGLASQGWRQSVDSNGDCVYRGENGLRCAAGWCISDDDYVPAMEKIKVYTVVCEYQLDLDPRFLDQLQRLHDMSPFPESMWRRFTTFAGNNNLTWPSDVPKEGPL